MNEDALRALVRETIARLGSGGQPVPPDPGRLIDPSHASGFKYNLVPSADGSCVIEPNVRCNHCGYCLSHGH